jgi:hypothetical protein
MRRGMHFTVSVRVKVKMAKLVRQHHLLVHRVLPDGNVDEF